MTSAARAVQSEQTAQTPPPRRKACDPEQPTIIPRDPDRDLALKDREQKILKAILSIASDDPRLPGRRRWCCWARNETILAQLATMGQAKGHSYLDRGLGKLRGLRLESKTMTEFRQWLIEEAPRRGMPCEPPPQMRKRKGRVLIILAELPPVVSEVYGPLEIPPPDDAPEHLEVRCDQPQSEVRGHLKVRCANRGEIPMESSEYGENSSSTCVCDPEAGTTTDDELVVRDGEELLAAGLRPWLRMPDGTFQRRMAESALRQAVAARDGTAPRAVRISTFVESVAAGRERDLTGTVSPTPRDGTSPGDDAPAGRIGRLTADRLAKAVRDLKRGEHGQAERIVGGLLSALGAEDDADLSALLREAIGMVAEGQYADAVAQAIREAPNGRSPRGLLISKLRPICAAKNPSPERLAKVSPVTGRNHYPRQTHSTVAK